MENLKGKVKNFVKENKTVLIVGGVLVSSLAYKSHVNKLQRAAYIRGGVDGFHMTIDWFDKTFDNVNLRELWNGWAAANPDKVKHY